MNSLTAAVVVFNFRSSIVSGFDFRFSLFGTFGPFFDFLFSIFVSRSRDFRLVMV